MQIHETHVDNTSPPFRMVVIDVTKKVSHIYLTHELGRRTGYLHFSCDERNFIIKHGENETRIDFEKDVQGVVNTIEKYDITTSQNGNTVSIFVKVFFYTARIELSNSK